MDKIKNNIAKNISAYRKKLNLTQAQLADMLNYSDKAVSKWERAEAAPDIYILSELANIFGTTVDALIRSDAPIPEKLPKKSILTPRNKTIISLLSVGLVWLVATITFAILQWAEVPFRNWLVFIYALPVSSIVAIVFSSLWSKRPIVALFTSILVWTFALAFFLTFKGTNVWLLFIIGIPLQVLIILWLFLKRNR